MNAHNIIHNLTSAFAESSPLLLSTPKDTGVHTVTFAPPSGYTVAIAYVSNPPSNSYSPDRTIPALSFDATKASNGESGIAGISESSIFLSCVFLQTQALLILCLV